MRGFLRLRAGWEAPVCGLIALSALALEVTPADAGVPGPSTPGVDPLQSGIGVHGQGAPCQFRFRPDGGADVLTVSVTLRDAFNNPVAGCSTSVTLVPVGAETFNLCACCGEVQSGFSNAQGILHVMWDRIGGFGTLQARAVFHCSGNLWLDTRAFDYTSSDLTGDCSSDGPDVDVLDVALWARGIAPGEWIRSDWDCSGGSADILDLGAWAGGLGRNCDDGGPCP